MYDICQEPIVISKVTLDILLKQDKPSDLIALYTFYYYTAKWQKTNQPRCTTAFTAKGLKWREERLIKAKKILINLNLIENVVERNSANRVSGHYIKVNFIWMNDDLNTTNFHPLEKPGGWKTPTLENPPPNAYILIDKCLDTNKNKTSLSTSPNQITSKDIFKLWNHYVKDTPISKIINISDSREKHLHARIKEMPTFNEWRSFLKSICESEFLTGKNNRSWVVTFDWIICNDHNFTKVREGMYWNKETSIKKSTLDARTRGMSTAEHNEYLESDERQQGMTAREYMIQVIYPREQNDH